MDKLDQDESLLKTMEKDLTVRSTLVASHDFFCECSHALSNESAFKHHRLVSVLSQIYWKKQSIAFSSYQEQEKKR